MNADRKRTFYWRAFVTFYVVFSFLVIATSGIVLFISPPGRIANWSQWTIGGLQKSGWQAVHSIFAFLFVVAAGFHIYFNWRVILNYIRRKIGEGLNRGKELAAASAVGVVILVLTIAGLPPFSTVMTLGETAKNAWSDPSTEPPVPHAEEWTVAKFAETNKMPADQAMENLRQAGLAAPGGRHDAADARHHLQGHAAPGLPEGARAREGGGRAAGRGGRFRAQDRGSAVRRDEHASRDGAGAPGAGRLHRGDRRE